MTATYDLTTVVGQIRLKIGDTEIASPAFTDEELEYFYSQEGSIILAAAAALEAWAAKYAANADRESIGDYSYAQSTVKKMLDLAARLRTGDAETPALTWAEPDLMGVDDEEDTE